MSKSAEYELELQQEVKFLAQLVSKTSRVQLRRDCGCPYGHANSNRTKGQLGDRLYRITYGGPSNFSFKIEDTCTESSTLHEGLVWVASKDGWVFGLSENNIQRLKNSEACVVYHDCIIQGIPAKLVIDEFVCTSIKRGYYNRQYLIVFDHSQSRKTHKAVRVLKHLARYKYSYFNWLPKELITIIRELMLM